MMTHVEITAVDHARAKSAAKAVKSRLHDLGNDVCLNHAYEAVAASLGFKTWAVMKASLDCGMDPQSVPSQPPSHPVETFPPSQAGLAWRHLQVGENNPVVMIHGPPTRKRDIVLHEVASHYEKAPGRIRAITLGKPEDELAHALTGDYWNRGPSGRPGASVFHLHPTSDTSSINIFDLPFGTDRPSAKHLARIVAFLGELTLLNQAISGEAFLSNAVNQMYARFIDDKPFRYCVGNVPQIDEFCQQAGIALDVGQTSWREIALELADRLQLKLARVAWRHSCPTLQHLMLAIRDHIVMDSYGSVRVAGELMVDVCARMVSVAIREYPFLRRPTAFDFGQSQVEVVGIDVRNGHTSAAVSLLYRLAFEASAMECGDIGSDTLLLISGAELVWKDLPALLASAHEEDGPRIVFAAADGVCVDEVARFVTSHVIAGCASRASVQELCSGLSIGPTGFESIHERLFGNHDDSKLEAYCIRRKFVNQREGLVTIPIRRDR
jgi:hypothetical protein